MTRTIVISFFALLLLTSCTGTDQKNPTPLPQAWPRLSVYPETYSLRPGLPVPFMLNDSVRISRDSDIEKGWYTLQYPSYPGQLYLTFTPVTSASRTDVIANRNERMELNAGGLPQLITEISAQSGDYQSTMLRARTASSFPLQFIAQGEHHVISGVYFLSEPADYDSIAPIVDAVERDLLYALKNLK